MPDAPICFFLISSFAHNSALMISRVIYDFLFEIDMWTENKLKIKIL